MNESEVKEYLIDFQKKDLPQIIPRDIKVGDSGKIISIIGPRRAGKTFYLFQKIQELLRSKIKKEQIVYLNFEDPRLIGITFKEIREIIKLHWQLYPSSINSKLYVFVDEPQNISQWEIAIRNLYDDGHSIIITGSSSRMLSKEIATSLRGRTISYIVLPFSFKEFLEAKGHSFDIQHLSSKQKPLLQSLLAEYAEFGGFPDIVLEKNEDIKLRILKEYFDLIVYRDIVERYKIKNTNLIKWFIKSFISSYTKEFSTHKLFSTLKSTGIKASKNTLYTYASAIEDAMFGFFIPKFSFSVRKNDMSIHKAYIADNGFANLIQSSPEMGKRMENMVFLNLETKKGPLTTISYWKNIQQEEVDFVVKDRQKIRQLIQVCRSLDDPDVKKREIRPLIKASKMLKCNNLIIITENNESIEIVEKKKIHIIPLWKWLLQ